MELPSAVAVGIICVGEAICGHKLADVVVAVALSRAPFGDARNLPDRIISVGARVEDRVGRVL